MQETKSPNGSQVLIQPLKDFKLKVATPIFPNRFDSQDKWKLKWEHKSCLIKICNKGSHILNAHSKTIQCYNDPLFSPNEIQIIKYLQNRKAFKSEL